MDLLVNLYSRRMAELARRVEGNEATIRVALPPELHIVQDRVRRILRLKPATGGDA